MSFDGNEKLKPANVIMHLTIDEILEKMKCEDDPIYFISNYIKVVAPGKGLVKFNPYPYQVRMAKAIVEKRFVIGLLPRQCGKCVFINTLITIKHKETGIERQISIGDFYKEIEERRKICREDRRERLCNVSTLWDEISGSNFTLNEGTQNKKSRLPLSDKSRKLLQKQRIQNQQSWKRAWRAFISMVEEREKLFRRIFEESREEQSVHFQNRLLVGENQRGYGISKEAVHRKTDDVYFGNLYSSLWRKRGTKNTQRTPGEVARNSEFKITRRDSKDKRSKINIGKGYIKGRKRNLLYSSREDTRNSKTKACLFFRRPYGLRLSFREKIDRIQWGLLARKPQEISRRFLQQNFKHDSQGYLAKRSNEKTVSRKSWIQSSSNMGIGLQKRSNKNNTDLSFFSNRKFIKSFDVNDYLIKSDTGWHPVTNIHKTIKYQEWVLKTNNHELICADDHIVFLKSGEQVFVKDLRPGDFIKTERGNEEVVSVVATNSYSHMYDVSVDSEEHSFYSNGILSHNSTIVSAIIAWMLLFSKTDAINILIAANKSSSAVEIMRKVKIAIENVPSFLQQGIKKWNEFGIELENGNRCTATATSGDTGRSGSYDLIMLDEFAFVKPNIAEEFYTSSYPTISSNPKSKVVVVSTPNGMNLFHNMWTMAQEKKNEYYPIEIKWNDVPGRDERFKAETISNLGHNGVARWAQEYECEFAGGASSLIPSSAILAQPIISPIEIIPPHNIKVFKKVNPGDNYMICVDTGRGRGIDFSAFTVINISRMPYEVVATYKNDSVDHMYYPDIIYAAATIYNNAQCLIETNDLGESVAKLLYEQLEYENVLFVETKGRGGQVLVPTGTRVGMTTSVKTKAIGCSALKALCEAQQILVHDHDIIYEMSNFIRIGSTYKAQKGNHDDLIMTLVMFSWATTQQYFSDMTDLDIKSVLYEQKIKQAEEQMLPFGFRADNGHIDYGLNDTLFTDDF